MSFLLQIFFFFLFNVNATFSDITDLPSYTLMKTISVVQALCGWVKYLHVSIIELDHSFGNVQARFSRKGTRKVNLALGGNSSLVPLKIHFFFYLFFPFPTAVTMHC